MIIFAVYYFLILLILESSKRFLFFYLLLFDSLKFLKKNLFILKNCFINFQKIDVLPLFSPTPPKNPHQILLRAGLICLL